MADSIAIVVPAPANGHSVVGYCWCRFGSSIGITIASPIRWLPERRSGRMSRISIHVRRGDLRTRV